MPPLRLSAVLPLVLALLAGCNPTPPPGVSTTGAMRLAAALPTAAPGDISPWAANADTLGTTTSGTSSSRVPWTAPTCVNPGTTPSLTATVTNAFGLTTTKSFTVMGLPACVIAEGWKSTGSMTIPRYDHTAALLPNGKARRGGTQQHQQL